MSTTKAASLKKNPAAIVLTWWEVSAAANGNETRECWERFSIHEHGKAMRRKARAALRKLLGLQFQGSYRGLEGMVVSTIRCAEEY